MVDIGVGQNYVFYLIRLPAQPREEIDDLAGITRHTGINNQNSISGSNVAVSSSNVIYPPNSWHYLHNRVPFMAR